MRNVSFSQKVAKKSSFPVSTMNWLSHVDSVTLELYLKMYVYSIVGNLLVENIHMLKVLQ